MNTVSVNGLSCSYARLGKYSNCASAEKSVSPSVVAPVAPAPVAPVVPAPVVPAPVVPAPVAPVAPVVKKESFDPSPTTLPVTKPSAVNYTPSYTVPNYGPVRPTLVAAGNSCAGYPNIMDAYGKDAGNCVTNYINN